MLPEIQIFPQTCSRFPLKGFCSRSCQGNALFTIGGGIVLGRELKAVRLSIDCARLGRECVSKTCRADSSGNRGICGRQRGKGRREKCIGEDAECISPGDIRGSERKDITRRALFQNTTFASDGRKGSDLRRITPEPSALSLRSHFSDKFKLMRWTLRAVKRARTGIPFSWKINWPRNAI